MNERLYFEEQWKRYPLTQPIDAIKQCYQAAHGAEHMLRDVEGARAYFCREMEEAAEGGVLYERIGESVVRIHLGPWRREGLDGAWLFAAFCDTAHGDGDMEALLRTVGEAAACGAAPFSLSAWQTTLAAWREAGMPAVHHSDVYREAYHPAYRIVRAEYLSVLPVLRAITARTKRPLTVAIDGRAAAGKTTMAELLSRLTGADVIHMDDFFLPPALRCAERLAEPGGNVHYERFAEEVLPHLCRAETFRYRIFDCSRMDYAGERVIRAHPLRIVEGSYAHHRAFGAYADLRIFLSVEPQEQLHRITLRNGAEMAAMFCERWIPMEERYIAAFDVERTADLRLS